jgi:hypothetical protein
MRKRNIALMLGGVLLAFALSASAAYNITLDQSSISFYTAADFANGVEISGSNSG